MSMDEIPAEAIEYFANLIEKETGIQYNLNNSHLLQNRLKELFKVLQYNSFDLLWKDIQAKGIKPLARDLVFDLATNNETSFFRDPDIFNFFKNEFIPNAKSLLGIINIWCAACSTGQEPYSLAMIMAELEALGKGKPYTILATDYSDRVLKQASSGIYSQLEIQRGLPAPLMIKNFTQVQVDGSSLPSYKINPNLAYKIQFKKMNLLEPWPNHGNYHIVFCRNMLIYQSIENRKSIIAKIAKILHPGGYLVLGGAESLIGLSDAFELKRYQNACVYQLK